MAALFVEAFHFLAEPFDLLHARGEVEFDMPLVVSPPRHALGVEVALLDGFDIVHGRVGTTSAKYADQRVNDLLGASVAITEAASKQGFNPYSKLKKVHFAGPTKKRGDHQPSEE